MDPQKLKVVELRAELSKRGLDTKGNKPVLVERLRQALDEEQAADPKAHSEASHKSEKGSESEEEGSNEGKTAEPARLPPRTPSRSSRHTSREPTTPAKTPTRRSSSRSSLSRQSPAKTTPLESLSETASALEPIAEEDKASPKKESVLPTPKKETAPAPTLKKEAAPASSPKKEAAPAPSPKKEVAPTPSPKKEVAPAPSSKKESTPTASKTDVTPATPKKETAPDTPKKENVTQNESPKSKLEVVKEAEKHVGDQSQEIIKKSSEDVCMKPATNAQSPVKPASQSPIKPTSQSPIKSISQSQTKPVTPSKSVSQSPVKSATESEATTETQNPVKSATQSPTKIVAKSPEKSVTASPLKGQSPVKAAQSPVKTDVQSPVRADLQSPTKIDSQSPVKTVSPAPAKKVEHSSLKKDAVESPAKKLKSEEETTEETTQNEENIGESEDKPASEEMEVDQENDNRSMETDEQEAKDEKTDDRKRKRSPSPQEEAPRAPPIARPENEPSYDENSVLLSWYDSDMNLVINTMDYFSASPMQGDGFNFMWAGARVSHGFNKGKVYYEAKVISEFDNLSAAAAGGNATGAIPADDEKIPSLMRVGWSTIGTSLQLGEEKLSYGYEGTGKKATNKEFVEYGKSFFKNDVVGCYADFETDEKVTLTFTVNGESQGPAFEIQKEELKGKALFPHVLCKNCSFKLNLGQEDSWSTNILDGYEFVGKIDLNDRIAGPRRPEKRENCEVILLCGLPFSGKTTWAIKHVAENPDKLYSVLGTHNLIEKMRVEGTPLKDNYKGRWENVVEKCSRALTKLLDSAPSRRRNYILDQQSNVYGSNQRRKMRNFYGFHRKAVILVPSDEEIRARTAKRKEEADGEEIRESSILEVKANISAPTVGESFEEVVWEGLGEEEGKKLIESYNTEGKTAGYGQNQQQQNKRSRFDNGQKDRNNRDNRDHRRSGFNDRRSSGAWRGAPGGGWRDAGRMRGSPMRHGPSYGPPVAWRGRGGPVPQSPRSGGRGGSNDRRPGNERNRPPGGQRSGGWNSAGYQGNQHSSSGVWNQGSWQAQSQSWGSQQSGTGGAWNQQQAWGGAGNWKGYGQNSYGQSTAGYGQQNAGNYGNGNWNNWNPQYYNQYWGGSGGSQQQTTGQAGGTQTQVTGQGTGGGQAVSKK